MLKPSALIVFATLLGLLCSSFASAQQPRASAAKLASDGKSPVNELYIAYRMDVWGTAHFQDVEKANKHADVLKQLGCEVKTVKHDGHTDIQCRAPIWKSLALKDQAQIDQWQTWFEAFGFEALHARPVGTARKAAAAESAKQAAAGTSPSSEKKVLEIVEFRLPEWRTFHPATALQLSESLALYRALDCETTQAKHGDHTDLKVRCVEWREIKLPSHQAAHEWQNFLNQAGFETRHEH